MKDVENFASLKATSNSRNVSARHSKFSPALVHKTICFQMQGVTAKFAVDRPDILS
jgi:hypothetical protein